MRLLLSFVTKAAEYVPNMVPSAKGLGARDQARESKATCALAGPERNGRVSALSLKLQSMYLTWFPVPRGLVLGTRLGRARLHVH